jgi:asparagine synthase (glutamine-hydrolysing)
MNRDLATRYAHAATVFPDDYRSLMYQSDYFTSVRDHNPHDRLVKMFHPVGDLDMMAQMQYVDTQMYLPDDILVKVDKASMFNSLETRAPLLDQHLAEYVSSLPSAIRTRGNTLKYLLKKASANLVPPEILARPKKGFSVPIKHWFRGDLTNYARDLLDSPRAHQRGIFKPQFVRSLLEAHTHSKLMNYSSAIWALLCLELWFQAYMDQPPVLEAQSFGHEQSVHNQV